MKKKESEHRIKTEIPARCRSCRDGSLCTENLSLFRELPARIQAGMTGQAVFTHAGKGAYLFEEGDAIDAIRIIRSGRVKLCRVDEEGTEYILDVLSEGNSIWEGLFSRDAVYPYAAVCLTDVTLCEIPGAVFMREVAGRPEVAMYLISLLSERLTEAKERAQLLTIRDPRMRIAGFLLDRDRRWPEPEIRLKLEEVAASIGLRQETVSRCMRAFEKEGIIKRLGHGRFRILSREKLKEAAAR